MFPSQQNFKQLIIQIETCAEDWVRPRRSERAFWFIHPEQLLSPPFVSVLHVLRLTLSERCCYVTCCYILSVPVCEPAAGQSFCFFFVKSQLSREAACGRRSGIFHCFYFLLLSVWGVHVCSSLIGDWSFVWLGAAAALCSWRGGLSVLSLLREACAESSPSIC